ncbi:hypothetical protein NTE_02524 [Candidatus Nitrososphaera evergladensis SR1]|uniref:Uncharacterized protein n=1 Tax=Candidatus Nitrososphaera evergladensis SR1 TaxID=1459636 RepID=A0A075MTV3_9ARCH|nr:hypothetical protein [Candidatus Nitrososphaera evergladensis]AIF84573.1 hypothetical protein NTE_02524 [Candidatus Nitrososphaera evergladensis SR1]
MDMNKKVLISIPIIGVAIFVIVVVGALNNWWRLTDVPVGFRPNNKELVKEKLGNLPEVKAFHNRYAEPNVTVLGRQVIYEKTEAQITGVQYNGTQRMEPQVTLLIDIDYDANVERMAFTCINDHGGGIQLTKDKNSILEYLEKESCFS